MSERYALLYYSIRIYEGECKTIYYIDTRKGFAIIKKSNILEKKFDDLLIVHSMELEMYDNLSMYYKEFVCKDWPIFKDKYYHVIRMDGSYLYSFDNGSHRVYKSDMNCFVRDKKLNSLLDG